MKNDDLLKRVVSALQDRVIEAVSESTKISRRSVSEIKSGKSKNPRHATLQVLASYLDVKL
jgi:transcriptional regulator with XRE-family HTH domain